MPLTSQPGRLQQLLEAAIEQAVRRQPNPVIEAVFEHCREDIRKLLARRVDAKRLEGAVREAQALAQQIRRARDRRRLSA